MWAILEVSGIYHPKEATARTAKAPDRCPLPDDIDTITTRSRSINERYSLIYLKNSAPQVFRTHPRNPPVFRGHILNPDAHVGDEGAGGFDQGGADFLDHGSRVTQHGDTGAGAGDQKT